MDKLVVTILPEDTGKDNFQMPKYCPIACGLTRLKDSGEIKTFSIALTSIWITMINGEMVRYSISNAQDKKAQKIAKNKINKPLTMTFDFYYQPSI